MLWQLPNALGLGRRRIQLIDEAITCRGVESHNPFAPRCLECLDIGCCQ